MSLIGGDHTPRKGEDEWITVCRTYRDFPEDSENPGERLHSFPQTSRSGSSAIVTAQPYVKTWGGQTVEPGKQVEVKATPSKKEVNGQPTQYKVAKAETKKPATTIPDPGEDEDLILA